MNEPRHAPLLALALLAALAAGAPGASGAPGAPGASGAEPEDAPTWSRDVRPILAEHCFLCHGPDAARREARLRLDTAGGLTEDRGGYRAVEPGDPASSELVRRVAAGDDLRMPPAEHGPRLDPADVETLRAWVVAGGRWEEHWGWAPFREVELPAVHDAAWVQNDIDRFVLARLEQEGLEPAPEADRRTLIRRVGLDLVGLPPTPAEVEAFLADERPDAYERVVDRLLASPAYAERQARHWLDLARYADSHGFTIDSARSMWPWRDWVVRAIDADLPYDRFTVLQLAGDLAPESTNADVVATGFHRNTQINQEGGAKDEENRVHAVFDRVETTAAVWLGATVGCARCHDHKFDPVSQREYFGLFAFFNSTEDGGVRSGPSLTVADADSAAELAAFEAERERRLGALAAAQAEAARGWTVWRPERATAENGPELVLAEDGALASVAHNPETSVYVLEGRAPTGGFGALRLEALPDRALPARGPGRSGDGNFVLTGVRVLVRATGAPGAVSGDWRELPIAAAVADFEQDTRAEGGGTYPVGAAIDGDAATGWAVKPRFGEPHVAVFTLAEPFPSGLDTLRVELEQAHGGQRVLGRFRLLLDAPLSEPGDGLGSEPGDGLGSELTADVPAAWRAAWRAADEHEDARPSLPTVLVMRERAEPRPTHLFLRGNFLDPGEPVEPGYPAALDRVAPMGRPSNRLDLAHWLVHPENALAHRVTVNRWWQRYFGLGLVETEDDFGLRGARPSHPDLLEWLAKELVRTGFSRKALHRLIVTSATYRQSARPRAEVAAVDPRNRLLARQARLRLDAEVIRDAALAASGLLSLEVGGPPVQPPQPAGVFAFTQSARSWTPSEGPDRYRRSLYTRLWRSATYPFYVTFDAPVANVACTRRLSSSTPLQALALANDPMIGEIAAGLGARVRTESESDADRITHLWELCLARPPTAPERAILLEHVSAVRAERDAAGATEAEADAGAWTAAARVVLNLDEFVTRE